MRRPYRLFGALLLTAAGVAIGIISYNAGYAHGVEASGRAVEVVRTVGPEWGFFPFGFFLFPLLFFAILAFARGQRGYWGHHYRWDRTEERGAEWHRRQHAREDDPARV